LWKAGMLGSLVKNKKTRIMVAVFNKEIERDYKMGKGSSTRE
jgi:hypothetical protein